MEQPQKTPETPQEESIFEDIEVDTRAYQKHIRRARILLFIIAGLQLIAAILLGIAGEFGYEIEVGVQVVLGLVFAGLAFWTKYKPYAALLIALVIYVGIFLLSAILEPSSIISGLLIKIVIVVLLIRGISNARDAEEMKKTFQR
jgi:hypothetical protein